MIKKMKSFIRSQMSTFVFLAFILIAFIGMLAKPNAFNMYFISKIPVYDAGFYTKIASNGYTEFRQTAFYPLWPFLLSPIKYLGNSDFVLFASIFALFLFWLSLIILQKFAKIILTAEYIFPVLIIYALNPNSLFHALPYAESLSALLSASFLYYWYELLQGEKKQAQFLLSAAALSASRPILLQSSLSMIFAVLLVSIFSPHERGRIMFHFSVGIRLILALVAGYIPYGIMCHLKFNDAFAPFHAQVLWDRKFGIHWSLILQPKSVSGSDNVLFWDIQAFYLPLIMMITAFWMPIRRNIVFWYCALFSAAHGAIAFLTYPIFMSLGRHIFALPFFALALGLWIESIPDRFNPKRIIWIYAGINACFLIYWWTRYARNGWIG